MVLSTTWPSRWSYRQSGHNDGLVDNLAITVVLSITWPSRWSYRQPGHHDGLIDNLAFTMVLSTPGHHDGLITLAITMVLSTPWPSRWSSRHPGHRDGLIDTLAITVRGIVEKNNTPFVTFQMLPSWTGTNPDRNAVQNALRDVGTRIPYAASIDVTKLPGSSLHAVHYSAAQQAELINRFFGA